MRRAIKRASINLYCRGLLPMFAVTFLFRAFALRCL